MNRGEPVHKSRNMCEDGCGQEERKIVHQPVEVEENGDVSFDGGGVLMFTGRLLLAMRDNTALTRADLFEMAAKHGLLEKVTLPTGIEMYRFTDIADLCVDQVPTGTIQ